MHREYILLNGFGKAKKVFTAGFHVPLSLILMLQYYLVTTDLPHSQGWTLIRKRGMLHYAYNL